MCQFQVYSKAVQPYPYKYPSFFKIFSHLGYYKTFLNSYYKASGQVGPKMTSSTENSDPGSQFRPMWDPGDLPTMSFLQMVHHQPGSCFVLEGGHYPLLQGCLRPQTAHKAWQVEHRVNPPPQLRVFIWCTHRTAGHRSLALPNASQVLGTLLKTLEPY